jgi:phage tail sheath protein FI
VHLPFGTRGTRTTLKGNITDAAKKLAVQTGAGALFPTTFPYNLIIDAEVVQVTGLAAADQFNVTRGFNGTTAAEHVDGSLVELQALPAITAATPGNDGSVLGAGDVNHSAGPSGKHGMYALEDQDIFNILVIPPLAFDRDVPVGVSAAAAAYCRDRRAFLIIDSPDGTVNAPASTAKAGFDLLAATLSPGSLDAQYAGYFFPRFNAINPLTGISQEFAASGAIAGVFARTDASRGVWKAPAGLEAGVNGILQLTYNVTDSENGVLNQAGVNCLRTFNLMGSVVWGSRTVQGSDAQASDWKYIPVRRVALFIEESLFRGTQWVVFEPNDEPLWAQIRLAIGAFMQNLFRQGAFQGRTPREAYFVKCDNETTTQNDINLGIVNILVGFAPLKPAEFVIIKIQQMAGQVQA